MRHKARTIHRPKWDAGAFLTCSKQHLRRPRCLSRDPKDDSRFDGCVTKILQPVYRFCPNTAEASTSIQMWGAVWPTLQTPHKRVSQTEVGLAKRHKPAMVELITPGYGVATHFGCDTKFAWVCKGETAPHICIDVDASTGCVTKILQPVYRFCPNTAEASMSIQMWGAVWPTLQTPHKRVSQTEVGLA